MTQTKLSVFCDKIMEAGWLIAMVVIPLFFNIYTARTFEPDKITMFRIIISVMVLAWVISLVERGVNNASGSELSLSTRFKEWLKTPLVLPTMLFSSIYLISAFLSISPAVSLWGSYQRLQGTYTMLSYIMVFALMATHLRTREQIDRFVTIVIITSVPVSLYGIVQKYGLDPLPWAGDVTTRVAANLGNAIFVSSYLIMVMPLTVSRLVKSMVAIIKEENASWGHTILAAIYIFVFAIQGLTVIYSGSRGPMIGIMVSLFVMGLFLLMSLRQQAEDSSRLTTQEIVTGLAFAIPLIIISAIAGTIGFGLGYAIDKVVGDITANLMGGALGGLLGVLGYYTYMAANNKGWRWLWLSWLSLATIGVAFILLLNSHIPALDPYIQPIREIPHLDKLTTITDSEGGTGKVRLLIWGAAMNLVVPHPPMGVEGDADAVPDKLNFMRPFIGYGPESMFNAFAFVYPPDLAHIENRGSSADRSHNETMDSLVITGWLGFLAYYYVMISVFLYGLYWLGWASTPTAKRSVTALLILSGAGGAGLAYAASHKLVYIPLGLPFGMVTGLILFLFGQGILGVEKTNRPENSPIMQNQFLLMGLVGAIIGHFIEVHFVFSIAATYSYFWAYRGLMLAIDRMDLAKQNESPETTQLEETTEDVTEQQTVKRGRSSRASSANRDSAPKSRRGFMGGALSWEMVLGGYGLALAIIMVVLTFDFITPGFQFTFANKNSMSLLWMYVITWVIGLAIAMSDIAIRQREWSTPIAWGRAIALYSVSSLSYFFFYYLTHRLQFNQQINVASPADAISAANILINGLLVLYLFLFMLMVLFAITLSWQSIKRLPTWRPENWWLYPPLVAAILALIWFKNIDVVRADIYLKEGERYRGAQQWEAAIALHERGRSIDSDEDFYYLMLALDYQLMAQDGRLTPEQRGQAQAQGEKIALEARSINPYNPDNTGNMGRYYFTLSQVASDPAERQAKMDLASDFFRKATILAPTNVIYHNLWAQTAYMQQQYDTAIERLEVSRSIDDAYPPTWVLYGDTEAALGKADEALKAHSGAMSILNHDDGFANFADPSLDLRLNFYLSSGKTDNLVNAMKKVALQRPTSALIYDTIAKTYTKAGQNQPAIPYYERSLALSNAAPNPATLKSLGNIYLSLEKLPEAEKAYNRLITLTPTDIESRSALAYVYAKQNRFDESITQHQFVLQQDPNNYSSLQNLAVLYQQSKKWREALDAAQKALKVAPEADAPKWQQFITEMENQLAANKGL